MIAQQGKVYGRKFVVISTDGQISNSLERVLLFAGASVFVTDTPESGMGQIRSQRPDMVIIYDPSNTFNLKQLHLSIISDHDSRKIPRLVVTNQFIIDELRDNLQDEKTDLIPSTEFDIVHAVFRIETILKTQIPKTADESKIFDISETNKPEVTDNKALPVRVFVVEDDMLMRDLLTTKFKNAGFVYNLFPSGEGAVAAINQFKPNVVVLDYTLPGKSGLEVLKELRTSNESKDIEVIIFSNRDEEADKEEARAYGVSKFLLKVATDLNDLVDIIKETAER